MPLETYRDSGLLFNANFLEKTSGGATAYRGELVLVEGEVADAKGHSKPPSEVMRGVALLDDGKLQLVIGAIDRMDLLPVFIGKYKGDFGPDMRAIIYVVNLQSAVQVELEGINFVLIPLVQGVPWNETIDELRLEKSDFKGQSAADKLVTLLNEIKSYKPTYPKAHLDEALAAITDEVRQGWGAV